MRRFSPFVIVLATMLASSMLPAAEKPDTVRVLLTTDHPKNNRELAWVKTYKKSPVFFLMLGHDAAAYRDANYRKLVHQGIRWAAGR